MTNDSNVQCVADAHAVPGRAGLDELDITSASLGLDEEALRMQPNAGGLFMLVPGVKGPPQVPFAG